VEPDASKTVRFEPNQRRPSPSKAKEKRNAVKRRGALNEKKVDLLRGNAWLRIRGTSSEERDEAGGEGGHRL